MDITRVIVGLPKSIEDELTSRAVRVISNAGMGHTDVILERWFEWDPAQENIHIHLKVQTTQGEMITSNTIFPVYLVRQLAPNVDMKRLSVPDWL